MVKKFDGTVHPVYSSDSFALAHIPSYPLLIVMCPAMYEKALLRASLSVGASLPFGLTVVPIQFSGRMNRNVG